MTSRALEQGKHSEEKHDLPDAAGCIAMRLQHEKEAGGRWKALYLFVSCGSALTEGVVLERRSLCVTEDSNV